MAARWSSKIVSEVPIDFAPSGRGSLAQRSRRCGGFTALHVDAAKGNLALTKQLLELGADPSVLADRNASVLITATGTRISPRLSGT